MKLPAGEAGARRLFPHYEESDLDLEGSRTLILAGLLEDGDSADLGWLVTALPEAEIAGWFGRHGGRRLSVRSRELWRVLLDCEPGPAHPEAQALWPL
ncbi:MAG TPA: hypothetical protein VF173_25560 [Thermoanaerobaculia bacterium]|nr:hypothetical protein [Thermoanaerobaculia bacterium]